MGHTFKLGKSEAFRLEGQIIENIVNEGAVMDVNDVRELKAINMEIAGNRNYALLVESGQNTSITKEARELVASDEFANLIIAKAVIIYTESHKFLSNLYLTVNKPKIKTKMFTDREKAMEWLRLEVFEHRQKNTTIPEKMSDSK